MTFAKLFDNVIINDDLQTAEQETFALLETFINSKC
jgi:hypothetical protein